jgi:signal transduction histidine kinase
MTNIHHDQPVKLTRLARRNQESHLVVSTLVAPANDVNANVFKDVEKRLRESEESPRDLAEEQLRTCIRQQAIVVELSQLALKSSDIATLLDKAVVLLAQTLQVEHCMMVELLSDSNLLLVRANTGGQELLLDGILTGVGEANESQMAYTLAASEPVVVVDFQRESRFRVLPVLLEKGLVSGVSVSIATQNRSFGILTINSSRQRTFTQDELHFLRAVAAIIAVAIERKQAENELVQALTSLRTANEQLEHTNQVQSNFVSIVSHEFRTTLTGIQGFSELIRDENFSFEEIKEFAADINTDARRLTCMISELLDLNRMKSGQVSLNLEQVDFKAVIMDVIERMRPTATQHRFRLQLDNAFPFLAADRNKLTQVVTNLLSNAVKYSPGGGEILISGKVEGHLVHVCVQDQGIGMPAHTLERIFEFYSRIESDSTRYIEGTGLGLPIVRQIVQLHGGKVWAESMLGRGSIFHFTIPLPAIFSSVKDSAG